MARSGLPEDDGNRTPKKLSEREEADLIALGQQLTRSLGQEAMRDLVNSYVLKYAKQIETECADDPENPILLRLRQLQRKQQPGKE